MMLRVLADRETPALRADAASVVEVAVSAGPEVIRLRGELIVRSSTARI
jgi:hypothetical protein